MADTSDNNRDDLFGGKVIPTNLAITAMRDSGYKNTAYAIAELIDNSQQADASRIEVVCIQGRERVGMREVTRPKKIAVIDNGCGMDSRTLRKSLQFGNGSRLDDRTGIGRFGMGLPNASISQAGRVDVWSWKNGPDNALHTYLSVEELESGTSEIVPEPKNEALPIEWRSIAENVDTSGTLVLWSELEFNRLTWKKGKTTLDKTGQLAGRIYRKFLEERNLSIRLLCTDQESNTVLDTQVTINDPLYLLPVAALPSPFNEEPMFELFDTDSEQIEYSGRLHEVKIRYSIARKKTIDEANKGNVTRGSTKYGKHAAQNIGVSLLRAGRELMLDVGWCIGYDPRERWWGCEVEFPPELDEIFGVTNNKQHAVHFVKLTSKEWEDLAEEGEGFSDVIARLKGEGDPKGWLLPLSNMINRGLRDLRREIKSHAVNSITSGGERHPTGTDHVATAANNKWKEREKEQPTGEENEKPSETDLQELREQFEEDNNLSSEQAENLVRLIRLQNRKVVFVEAQFPDFYNLFNVQKKHGITEIVFNQKHPAFESIFGTINTVDEDIDALSRDDLIEKLARAVKNTMLIFAAWARLEMEANIDRARTLEGIRFDWGKMASHFVDDEHDQP